ncbi:CBS domain-containing protein [Tsukamurella sp. NPDC003166]|uniref:CBS domain-containing protein n=1 Tax=Tsukamurella sp. NPDC003166 TaxID=3154444 RepID=UPI0033AB3A36
MVRSVADAMLRHPTIHPPDITVGDAVAAFESSPKIHLLLLVHAGRLVGTLTRADIAAADLHEGAAPLARSSLRARTTSADGELEPLREAMVAAGTRRLAVVDDDLRLLGLLCLKASGTGFCTDDGVERMRRSRSAATGGDASTEQGWRSPG